MSKAIVNSQSIVTEPAVIRMEMGQVEMDVSRSADFPIGFKNPHNAKPEVMVCISGFDVWLSPFTDPSNPPTNPNAKFRCHLFAEAKSVTQSSFVIHVNFGQNIGSDVHGVTVTWVAIFP